MLWILEYSNGVAVILTLLKLMLKKKQRHYKKSELLSMYLRSYLGIFHTDCQGKMCYNGGTLGPKYMHLFLHWYVQWRFLPNTWDYSSRLFYYYGKIMFLLPSVSHSVRGMPWCHFLWCSSTVDKRAARLLLECFLVFCIQIIILAFL